MFKSVFLMFKCLQIFEHSIICIARLDSATRGLQQRQLGDRYLPHCGRGGCECPGFGQHYPAA